VRRQAHRLTVEVAGRVGDPLAAIVILGPVGGELVIERHDAVAGKEQGIVRRGVDLRLGHLARVGNGVTGGAVYGGSATQGINVLDRAGAFDQLASFDQSANVGGAGDLSVESSRLVDARIEGAGAAAD